MLRKLMNYEFARKAVLATTITIYPLTLLFKTVTPNFGTEPVAASWMAMIGAFVTIALDRAHP